MNDSKADARLAIPVLAAEQMFTAQEPAVVEPALDSRIAGNWNLRGYITGVDALFRVLGKFALGERRVFYGLVLESKSSPGVFAAVIRGTASPVEWGEDTEGLPERGRFPGLTEAGFTGLYETFRFQAPGASDMPLVAALKAITGAGALVVAGHSLGAALATYAAYDAALAMPGQVSLRAIASPHPGNAEFIGAVAAAVPDHCHWRNVNDVVPKVPVALGYEHLPNTVILQPRTSALEIKSDWGCSHHLLSYIALMDDSALAAATSHADLPYLGCIIRHA